MCGTQCGETTNEKPHLTCREVLDFLMDYTSGELTPEQLHEFNRHLAICPSCVNYIQSYKQTVALGRAAMRNMDSSAEEAQVPGDLVNAIREARKRD